jgi:hypothetical protein
MRGGERAKKQRCRHIFTYSALQKKTIGKNTCIKSDSVSRDESVFSFAPSALLLLREFHPRPTSSFDTGGGGEFLHVEWYNLSQLRAQTQTKACGARAHTHTHTFTCHRTLLNYDCANIVPCDARIANIITWRVFDLLLGR